MGIFSFLGGKPKTVLGLDISSSSVKLVELAKVGGKYQVESFLVKPLPANAVVEKNISDEAAVADAIRRVVSLSKTKTTDAACAVAGSSVITKVIEMPADLNDQGMENQIALEADQYIPYPLEEVSLDFYVVDDSANDKGQVEVLLAACRQENVDSRQQTLEEAGLTPRIIDVEVFALERAFSLIAGQMETLEDQVVAVADIGATVLTLTVLVDGKTVYSREQLFGGRQVTEEIQRRYGLSFEEAELAKKQGGLPEDYDNEILAPFKDALIQQISRSLQFFFSSSQYTFIDQLILSGGVAAVADLRNEVETKLGIPTEVANPFAAMSVSPRVDSRDLANDAPAMMLAVGLALRSFD